MSNEAYRQCKTCKQRKLLTEFYIANSGKPYRKRTCKDCCKERIKNTNLESKRKVIEYRRSYYQKNKDAIKAKVDDWVKQNPDRRRRNALAYYYRLQDQAIMAYGGYKCAWCGIQEPLVLCLDHIKNDGNGHRKKIGATGGHRFYKWLKDNGYPEGFQVLCMNCNHAKYRNGGVLPDTLQGRCNDHPVRE